MKHLVNGAAIALAICGLLGAIGIIFGSMLAVTVLVLNGYWPWAVPIVPAAVLGVCVSLAVTDWVFSEVLK